MTERPKDLIYALNERPPVLQLLALGFQHAAVICPYLVMVALVAGAAKLPHDEARDAMGLAMIAVGFLTILQSLRRGGVGSGYLCPPVVSAIYLPSSMAAASGFGFPVVCGMVMFAGGCEVLVARLVRRLRKLFPPVVSGVVIIAVGIELGKIGLALRGGGRTQPSHWEDVRDRVLCARDNDGALCVGRRASEASLRVRRDSCRLRNVGVVGGVS